MNKKKNHDVLFVAKIYIVSLFKLRILNINVAYVLKSPTVMCQSPYGSDMDSTVY